MVMSITPSRLLSSRRSALFPSVHSAIRSTLLTQPQQVQQKITYNPKLGRLNFITEVSRIAATLYQKITMETTTDLTFISAFPVELRTQILCEIYTSSDVYAVYGPPLRSRTDKTKSLSDDEDEEEDLCKALDFLYEICAEDIEALNLFKRVCNVESNVPWESYVRFVFPSPTAMLDVLLSDTFPPERRALIRHMCVYGYPLPVYPHKGAMAYHTHFADQPIPYIKGLKLDHLEYEDIYLPNDDGSGREAFPLTLERLMRTPGWRQLSVYTLDPHFKEKEIEGFIQEAENIRKERSESDFEFDLPGVTTGRNPETGRLESKGEAVDEGQTEEPTGTNDYGITEVAGGRFAALPVKNDVTEEAELRLVAKRGANAVYESTGTGGDSPIIGDLLEKIGWIPLRHEGGIFVNEGLGDPCAHL